DRVGGKWILFVGVALFAGGMGILIDSAHVDSTRLHLLPGLIVAGFGLGMTFAPLQTIAMRDVEPRMAGAASGIINTTRQLGAVIGSAAVGALLQSQLSAKLGGDAQAQINGPLKDVVPPSFHEQFVSGFKDAASAGLEVTGRGSVPEWVTHLSGQAQAQIGAASKVIFDNGFTNGMRLSLILPISMMGLAAISVLVVRRRPRSAPATAAPTQTESVQTPVG
ncbi:MAG TPA: MFS transporter, partial [Micromonosporaceae bacterium]